MTALALITALRTHAAGSGFYARRIITRRNELHAEICAYPARPLGWLIWRGPRFYLDGWRSVPTPVANALVALATEDGR